MNFGARRKAKVIIPTHDEESNDGDSSGAGEGALNDAPKLFKSKTGRKPIRSSGLRKVITTDEDGDTSGTNGDSNRDEADDGPAVIRPSLSSRASSVKKPRPKASSKLSFGAEASANDDDEEDSTPVKKPTLSKRTLEKNVFKNRSLPVRSMDEDDDRPRYDKEYLAELQSATPNTPHDVSALSIQDPDEMELDASELEGAMVVDTPAARPSHQENTTSILTEAEIREKKERRKRLAQEEGFLSVEDDDVADPFAKKKEKEESRLKTDEDDLGEGFDDYVEDGGLSLGKRAVKERSKREKKEMAELINTAEGNESDSSADSDAERRIAYEAAQTRAGMDGLKKPKVKPGEDLLQVPQKITPLPVLSECLARLQESLSRMETEVQEKNMRVEGLRREKEEIVRREGEVQGLLDETGRRYQEAMGVKAGSDQATVGSGNPELMGARGLESLGATPSREVEMME